MSRPPFGGQARRNISRSPKLMYRAALRIHKFTHRAVTLKRSALPVSGIGPLIAIHRGLYMGEAMTKPTQSQTSLCN